LQDTPRKYVVVTWALPCRWIFSRKSLNETGAMMNSVRSSTTYNSFLLVVGNHYVVLKHLLKVAKVDIRFMNVFRLHREKANVDSI
jgi:hypothetical protein